MAPNILKSMLFMVNSNETMPLPGIRLSRWRIVI